MTISFWPFSKAKSFLAYGVARESRAAEGSILYIYTTKCGIHAKNAQNSLWLCTIKKYTKSVHDNIKWTKLQINTNKDLFKI